jgi:hypothetical protein
MEASARHPLRTAPASQYAGDHLVYGRESISITTLRAAAKFVGVELSPDPGVGRDLPPYAPDADLAVDARASGVPGSWYTFANDVLDDLRASLPEAAVSAAQLWPEHFDLAVTLELDNTVRANIGFSPGDAFNVEPYVYVGPTDLTAFVGEYWNAPFGAYLGYAKLSTGGMPREDALKFVRHGLRLLVSATSARSTIATPR